LDQPGAVRRRQARPGQRLAIQGALAAAARRRLSWRRLAVVERDACGELAPGGGSSGGGGGAGVFIASGRSRSASGRARVH